MQRYRWPGYEMQLLGELQRQQNNAQFCDILLETEGISVPTHSCILAALSPYLSEKLSASPSPSLGQKCRLKLQAVKAQTLLKLVGLLYSGELEIKGSVEQDEVLFAAQQFGITELVEEWKDGGMMEGGGPWKTSCGCCRERNESGKMQDAQVQAEMAEKRAAGRPVERRNCVSTGTQTVKAGEKTAGGSHTPSGQTKPTTREPAPSVAQSMDLSVTLQPQNITLDKPFNSTYFQPVSSGASSNGESTLDRSIDSGTNPTSTTAWTSDEMRVPISFNNDESNSLILQEDGSYQHSSVSEDRSDTELEDGKTNANMADNRQNAEQPGLASRDEIVGEKKGNCTEKKHVQAEVGKKRLAKMKQMTETAQISVKVKLRRRTKGEVWEVVSVQDTDETLSVRTSLKRTDPTSGEPSLNKSETPILQTAAPESSEQLPQPSTPSDSQLLCSECLTPNQSDALESVLLAPPPGPVEESDEQIEKLLEDIMMGLNILPNLERDCKKTPHHLQPNHDRALAVCQVPVTENKRVQSQVHAAVSAAGCVHYQDLGTPIGHSSTDTGVHCFTAQSQPSCSSLTSVQSDAVMIQQQRSPQYDTSVTSMGRREGTSYQGMPRSRSQNCPYPQTPTTRSVIPSAFNSSGQKIHYPGCQQPSSQSNQNILEFFPLSTGSVAQSSHSFFVPYMNELRLPRCLSPLEAFASAAKHDPILNNSTNHRDKIQPQPSLCGRPWLTENPALLQFPLSTITHPEDTNYSCGSKRQMKHPELNPHNRRTLEASCTAKKVEERGTISAGQNAAEVKSNHRKLKKCLKSKEGDTNSDAVAPRKRKRKCSNHPQDAAGLLAYKDIKVSDGTKNQIDLSICTVRLSSNNVLAKDREMATSSSNLTNKCLEKTDEMSVITESQTEQTREAEDLKTDQTRIRTRSFLKKTQGTPVNTGQESSSVFKPVTRGTKIMNKERDALPKRERGRPRKTKLETPLTTSKKTQSNDVEDEQKIDYRLLREEEDGHKTKRKCKKRRRDRSEVEVVQLEKTTSADGKGEVEADDNSDMIPTVRKLRTPKRSRMVTLKEFQKLIKRQHSKTRKSKESQDKETNQSARDGENEEKACENRCEETGVEVIQPQSGDAPKESGVISSVTVDQNHNQIFNKSAAEYRKSQQEDTNTSTSEDSSLISDEYRPGFSFDVLEEEVAKLAAEREQPLKDPHEAQNACDAGVSTTMQQTAVSNEGSSHSDTHMPPQEDKTPLEHNLNPQTPERTALPLSDGVAFIESSGCAQEEEEEVDVDVLLFSPDNVPQSRQCENRLDNMDISQEEEEDEDVNEIDVTGDEAE